MQTPTSAIPFSPSASATTAPKEFPGGAKQAESPNAERFSVVLQKLRDAAAQVQERHGEAGDIQRTTSLPSPPQEDNQTGEQVSAWLEHLWGSLTRGQGNPGALVEGLLQPPPEQNVVAANQSLLPHAVVETLATLLQEGSNQEGRWDGLSAQLHSLLESLGVASDAGQVLAGDQDDSEPDAEASMEMLAGLFALLPPEAQSFLQQWIDSGNALPGVNKTQDTLLEAGQLGSHPGVVEFPPPGPAHPSVQGKPDEGRESTQPFDSVLGLDTTDTPLPQGDGGSVTPAQTEGLERLVATPSQSVQGEVHGVMPTPMEPVTPANETAQVPPNTFASLPPIEVMPGEEAWGQAIKERVVWMVGHQTQSAEVHLDPPELGPLEIRVTMHQDQASVTFAAQHPFTREALEATLPRLRDMLGESNVNLVSVDVGQGNAGGSGNSSGRDSHWGRESKDGAPGDSGSTLAPSLLRARYGLVDDFV